MSLQYFINILLSDVDLSMFSATKHGAQGLGTSRLDSGSFTGYGRPGLALLLPRQADDDRRCARKYGELWHEYRRRVPYRIIPRFY